MVSLVLAANSTASHLTAAQYVAQSLGIMFCFNMSTFQVPEGGNPDSPQWADPMADEDNFAPSALSFNQWLDAAQAAGATYVVPTIKHQDGFCWWASDSQPHNISLSSGFSTRDLLAEFYSNARGRGLHVVPYFSIGDLRFEADYPSPSSAAYVAFVEAQLTEIQERCPNLSGLWTDRWGWAVPGSDYTKVTFATIREKISDLWPWVLLAENNHETDLVHTDILVSEIGNPAINPGNLLPAEYADTIFTSTHWFRESGSAVGKTAANVQTAIATNNAKNAAYLLSVGPGTDGLLASDITDVLEAI